MTREAERPPTAADVGDRRHRWRKGENISLPWFTPVAVTIVRQAPWCAVLSSQRTDGAELAGFPSRNVTHRRWRRAKDPPLWSATYFCLRRLSRCGIAG